MNVCVCLSEGVCVFKALLCWAGWIYGLFLHVLVGELALLKRVLKQASVLISFRPPCPESL